MNGEFRGKLGGLARDDPQILIARDIKSALLIHMVDSSIAPTTFIDNRCLVKTLLTRHKHALVMFELYNRKSDSFYNVQNILKDAVVETNVGHYVVVRKTGTTPYSWRSLKILRHSIIYTS